jgi:hypothetical protein
MGNPLRQKIMMVDNVVVILGKIIVEEILYRSKKVRWNLPLYATSIDYRKTSIL